MFFLCFHKLTTDLHRFAEELNLRAPIQVTCPIQHKDIQGSWIASKALLFKQIDINQVTLKLPILHKQNTQVCNQRKLLSRDQSYYFQAHPNPSGNWSEWLLSSLYIPNPMAEEVPNKPLDYYTCPFKMSKLDRWGLTKSFLKLAWCAPLKSTFATQKNQLAAKNWKGTARPRKKYQPINAWFFCIKIIKPPSCYISFLQ